MNRKGKNIVSFFVSFILMICLIISMLLVFFRISVANQNLYYKVIEKNQTIKQVTNKIVYDVRYVMLSNNIPQSVAENIVTKEEVRSEIQNSVSEMLNYFMGKTNEMKNVNTNVYAQRIKDVLNNYITENKIFLDSKSSKLVDELSESIENILGSELQSIDLNKLSKSNTANKIRSAIVLLNQNKIIFSSFAADLLLSVILVVLWRRSKSRGLAWIGYSLFSSGLLVFLIGFSGYLSKFYNNIAVFSPIVKQNIASIIETYLIDLTKVSLIFSFLGLFLISIYWIHVYKRMKRSKV